MDAHPPSDPSLKREIKELIVTQLRLKDVTPDGIRDDESLVQGSLSLDSIDFLELTVAMERRYGVKISDADEVQAIFASVDSIARHIARHRAQSARA
ncbi:MAG TPA: phosphopantetheine-binding protein [Candidatus Polarisedimenticolia bacterium]|nr:phosphopantetheine-binding protein [Candidatus Polarisedimenticolia bacterium]